MPKTIENLHCGACMEEFPNIGAVNSHLDECPAARYLLPLVYQLWGGGDKVGHPLSHFLQCCHEEAHLIKRYAYSIADDLNLERSEIHARLCEKLCLEYNEFRPFESSEITEIPNRQEAESILWGALFDYASKNLIKKGEKDSKGHRE